MGKHHKIEWACDLCGEKKPLDGGAAPPGWSVFEVADRYEERSWHGKAICPCCIDLANANIKPGKD